MVLEGDILEYENIGPVEDGIEDLIVGIDVELAAIELLANFVNFVWQQAQFRSVMRLSGGGRKGKELILRNPSTGEILPEYVTVGNMQITREDLNTAYEGARRVYHDVVYVGNSAYETGRTVATRAKRVFDDVVGGVADYFGPSKSPRNDQIVPYTDNSTARPFNITNSTDTMTKQDGRNMLEWKNTLTRLYHTYQRYCMSPVKYTKVWTGNTIPVHDARLGNGPGLYWQYGTTTTTTDSRDINFLSPVLWDGGFQSNPTTSPVSRFYRLGSGGIIYIFAADWPGTIMNPDPLTHDNTNGNLQLEFVDYKYNQLTTNKNIPREWIAVFAHESWSYITVYGTRWSFDFFNYSAMDYVVEIQLFSFKADVDAMDYEKQCLAAMGGAQGGTAAYIQKIQLAPSSDVNIIQNKRYIIPGLTQDLYNGEAFISVEDLKPPKRRIKMDVMRKYVIKRPNLTTYETNLTEKQIWDKYHDNQKGLYFRIMAWPNIPDVFLQKGAGLVNIQTQRVGPNSSLTNGQVGGYLSCNIYKKTMFKLDETANTF